jgi:hypothetical protein
MGQLCAVSFNRYGRLFYLDPGEYRPRVGDLVLVPTDDGPQVAECVWAPEWVDEETAGFPRLLGLAGDEDVRRDEQIRRAKADAKVAAKRLIREHDLPMKVVAVDHVPASANGPAPANASAPAGWVGVDRRVRTGGRVGGRHAGDRGGGAHDDLSPAAHRVTSARSCGTSAPPAVPGRAAPTSARDSARCRTVSVVRRDLCATF